MWLIQISHPLPSIPLFLFFFFLCSVSFFVLLYLRFFLFFTLAFGLRRPRGHWVFHERWKLYKDSVECGLLVRFGPWLQSVESDWVFLLQGKKVVKPGSGCDLVGCRSRFYFWFSLFVVFWAGILAGLSLSRQWQYLQSKLLSWRTNIEHMAARYLRSCKWSCRN